MEERKRRARGQLRPLEPGPRGKCRVWGIRIPTKERGARGRHLSHYETFRGTELKAEKRKEALLAQAEAGMLFKHTPMTVSELLDEWLVQKEREGKRTATLYAYRDAFRFYLKPALGNLMLRELTPLRVRDMLNGLQDRSLATSTIRYARTILRMALRDAISWGYLRENPAAGVKVPKGAEGRIAYAMKPVEAQALVKAALEDPDDLVFVFALLTGLRPEEYIGLQREYLSLEGEHGLVQVRRVAVKLRGGGWEFPVPKTRKGVREVPFPAWLCRELQTYMTLVDARRLALGPEWRGRCLGFPPPPGGALRGRGFVRRR